MKTNTMKAFLGLQSVKDTYLARVREHRAADQLVKGLYWQGGKGCAVGCTIHGDDHSEYERLLGIPESLARLEDSIFEGLPNELAMDWPERFLDSIQVGSDLSLVTSRFLHWLLVDQQDGVVKYADVKTKPAIVAVGNLYARRLSGDEPTMKEWNVNAAYAYAASSAKNSSNAYANAAYANAHAYAAYAHADADAYLHAYAASAANAAAQASAQASAAAAAAAYANAHAYAAPYSAYAKEKEAAKIRQSEKLIELLREAGGEVR